MPQNTTGQQDKEIEKAESDNHIGNLILIIEDLDSQISQWKAAAGKANCDDPQSLEKFIAEKT